MVAEERGERTFISSDKIMHSAEAESGHNSLLTTAKLSFDSLCTGICRQNLVTIINSMLSLFFLLLSFYFSHCC